MGGSSNIAQACYAMLWPSNGDFPSVLHDMCTTLNYLHKDQKHHEVQSYCYCLALLDCQAIRWCTHACIRKPPGKKLEISWSQQLLGCADLSGAQGYLFHDSWDVSENQESILPPTRIDLIIKAWFLDYVVGSWHIEICFIIYIYIYNYVYIYIFYLKINHSSQKYIDIYI